MKNFTFKLLVLMSVTLYHHVSFAQNLVPNPSFEDAVNYPVFDSPVSYSNGWSPLSNTPDYFHRCSSNGNWQIPNNGWGNQNPATGNAYCGFWAYNASPLDGREIIGRQLSETLIIGQKYYCSLKLSLAEGSNCGINKLGIQFSVSLQNYPSMGTVSNVPIPKIFTNTIITDFINWTTISGSFIADSAYQYIMISNFFSNANTDTIILGDSVVIFGYSAYYYVDDICVSIDSNFCINSIYESVNFNASDTLINKGDCINFTTLQLTNYTNLQWLFPGANPSASNYAKSN